MGNQNGYFALFRHSLDDDHDLKEAFWLRWIKPRQDAMRCSGEANPAKDSDLDIVIDGL
jgi:hypothetical protein